MRNYLQQHRLPLSLHLVHGLYVASIDTQCELMYTGMICSEIEKVFRFSHEILLFLLQCDPAIGFFWVCE